MAERRKSRKKKDEVTEPPTKEEYTIAKYLRFSCPSKKTTMMGHKVDYFTASKAVDCLLSSKWATNKNKSQVLFTTRESCVHYLDRLLQKRLFHRARKIIKKKVDIKKRKSSEKDEASGTEEKKEKKEKKEDKIKKDSEGDKSKVENGEEKKKEKRKIKLEMHEDQIFVDGNEAYVWIYDPVHIKTFIIGLGLVFGAIAICLFPLWPQEVRLIVYYISLAAAGFVGVIIGLAVVRVIIFSFIWTLTLGRHHFWLLPNLTEDVGFLDSFRPLYKYEYRGQDAAKIEKPLSESKESNEDEEREEKKDSEKENTDTDRESDEESEPKNGDNGFEMIDKDDYDQNDPK